MSIKFTTVPAKRLAESITGASTSFKVNNIRSWSAVATDLTSADFGTRLWAVFRNSAGTLMEIMEVDPATITSASSPITIILRGLAFTGEQTTEVAANKLTWVKGDTIVELGTHVPQLLQNTVQTSGAQTIDDVKSFSSFPIKTGSLVPTAAGEFATKSYVDSVGTGSATYDQNVFSGTAGETVASGDVCYFKSSDQRWWKAKSNAVATSLGVKLAVAQSAGTAGNAFTLLGAGLVKNLTGLTVGVDYYISNSTFGGITTTAGTYARFVGRAVTTTTLHFDPTNGTALTQYASEIYAADSVGTDAYAITLVPAITAYQDGMPLNFKAGTVNTGNATLNVNGLGAKNILKNYNTTLADGDIKAGQIVSVIYDATQGAFQMQSMIGSSSDSTEGTYLAGEAINALDAVILGDGSVVTMPLQTLNTSNSVNQFAVNGANWAAMTFTVPAGTTVFIKNVSLSTRQTQNGGQPAATTTLSIRATSGGNPTGADLDSATNTDNSYTAGITQRAYAFSGAVALTSGNTYALVWRTSAGSYEMWANRTSVDSGANWSTPTLNTTPAHVLTFNQTLTAGSIYQADSTFCNRKLTNFIGFAKAAISSGASGTVKLFGLLTGLSGLTTGADYYAASATAGTITATAPTISKKVGIALSTTTLLVQREKNLSGFQTTHSDGTTFANGTSYTAPCDGYISAIGPLNTTISADGVAFNVGSAPATLAGMTVVAPIRKGKTWSVATSTTIYFTALI